MIGGVWVWVCLATAVAVVFYNYPPPEMSPNLKAWQKKGQIFKFKGYNIFYIVEEGSLKDERTLVLIHGFPTSSYDWVKVLDGLKKEFSRVVLLDMLGFGFSDKPRDHDYTIFEQADIVESLLAYLTIPEAHMMSHDYGDTVALELLARQDGGTNNVSWKTLCLTNGGLFPGRYYPRLGQKLLLVPYLGSALAHLSTYRVFKKGFTAVFGKQPSEEESSDFYAAISYNRGYLVNPKIIVYLNERTKYQDRWVGALRKSSIPVHMIYGPADPINPPPFADHYRKVVSNPSIEVLDSGIGHYPQVEDPESVCQSYRAFIRKHAS